MKRWFSMLFPSAAGLTSKDRWILRVVALVVSVFLWITVVGGKRSEVSRKVPIDFQLPKNLVVSNPAPSEVVVKVSGPRVFVREFQERDFSLPVDLSKARVGDYEVSLSEDMFEVPLGLKILSISPQIIPLRLDRVATRRVPVRAAFSGSLPEGFRMSSVDLRPSTVEIRGSQSRVLGFEAISTEPIALSATSPRQEFQVSLNLSEMPGVRVEDGAQSIQVTIELEGAFARKWLRNIPVQLRTSKGLVDPSEKPELSLKPQTVSFLIEGPQAVVDAVETKDVEVWAELPASLGGSKKRVRLDWRLKPELRVVRRTSDWVDLSSSGK